VALGGRQPNLPRIGIDVGRLPAERSTDQHRVVLLPPPEHGSIVAARPPARASVHSVDQVLLLDKSGKI